MTNQTTLRTLPPPATLTEITDHLVSEHGWPANTPINGDHALAHDYAHGVGRPDLTDENLTHRHRAAAQSWSTPAIPQAASDDYLRRIHWWVRLFGLVWIGIPLLVTVFGVVFLLAAMIMQASV